MLPAVWPSEPSHLCSVNATCKLPSYPCCRHHFLLSLMSSVKRSSKALGAMDSSYQLPPAHTMSYMTTTHHPTCPSHPFNITSRPHSALSPAYLIHTSPCTMEVRYMACTRLVHPALPLIISVATVRTGSLVFVVSDSMPLGHCQTNSPTTLTTTSPTLNVIACLLGRLPLAAFHPAPSRFPRRTSAPITARRSQRKAATFLDSPHTRTAGRRLITPHGMCMSQFTVQGHTYLTPFDILDALTTWFWGWTS